MAASLVGSLGKSAVGVVGGAGGSLLASLCPLQAAPKSSTQQIGISASFIFLPAMTNGTVAKQLGQR